MTRNGVTLDNITYNTLLHGYFKGSNVEQASPLIGEMLSENVLLIRIMYNILVHFVMSNNFWVDTSSLLHQIYLITQYISKGGSTMGFVRGIL